MRAAPTLASVSAAVRDVGLVARGAFHCRADDDVPPVDGRPAASLLLVGGAGREGWDAFAASPERHSGDDPLERFSERVIGALAARLHARALFPHRGPPWLPFQRWAARAEPVRASPIGVLMHPRHGLWHAYRGALAFASPLAGVAPPAAVAHPCDACSARPCLHACPVDAFGERGYDVAACAAHLARPAGAACLDGGCRARDACPVAPGSRYGEEQVRFHMRAFARSRGVALP